MRERERERESVWRGAEVMTFKGDSVICKIYLAADKFYILST
jgi:hypothetical protein